MAVVTRYLIERNGQLVTDQEGNYLMHVDKAEADAIDRKLDAIEMLAVIMSEQGIDGVDYDVGYKLAEGLVERVEEIQEAIRPVIADNKKRQKSRSDG
jgi:dsDNA-binding SOS-regulon protein